MKNKLLSKLYFSIIITAILIDTGCMYYMAVKRGLLEIDSTGYILSLMGLSYGLYKLIYLALYLLRDLKAR